MTPKSLTSYLCDYKDKIDANGCFEIPGVPHPTLQNSIHSMFAPSRWMTGYGQPSSSVHDRMKPALRLATLMITEDCTLPWFTHLRFGREQKQRERNSGKTRVYLAPTAREHKASSIETVKGDIEQLSRILTFQFVPPDYSTEGKYARPFGRTQDIYSTPWDREFSRSDYPYIDPKYTSKNGPYKDRHVPCIVMNRDFASMFSTSNWEKATPCQRYRIFFVFAVTLVHEIAHAYNWWLFDPSVDEPMWSQFDQRGNELGFAWEAVTIGKIIDPFNGSILGAPCLTSSETHSWSSRGEDRVSRDEDRHARLEKMMDTREVEFKRIPVGRDGNEPYWRPEESLRSNQWFCEVDVPAHKNVLMVMHVIPMQWIISWFKESHWDSKRRLFSREGRYKPDSLGPTFVLIYERSGATGKAALHYATRADVDMYLEDVGYVTDRMNLYDGDARFEFAEGGRDYDSDNWSRSHGSRDYDSDDWTR